MGRDFQATNNAAPPNSCCAFTADRFVRLCFFVFVFWWFVFLQISSGLRRSSFANLNNVEKMATTYWCHLKTESAVPMHNINSTRVKKNHFHCSPAVFLLVPCGMVLWLSETQWHFWRELSHDQQQPRLPLWDKAAVNSPHLVTPQCNLYWFPSDFILSFSDLFSGLSRYQINTRLLQTYPRTFKASCFLHSHQVLDVIC